ncbi:MAG: YfhO family protein [Anaerolineae bacterium]|nr:YfhO family protein [Anaerolineae bacterium]
MTWLSRIQSWLEDKPIRADITALAALTLLWCFYFWRVLTPNLIDQVSLPEGDFSSQFLACGAYQAERLLSGEIPLWNPYNYGGHPFLADVQTAVFYPPRLLTIVISHFTGGWNYNAVQIEALAHYWLASVWMYLFIRTMTRSRIAGMVSAIALAYGGYLTGYPPVQLAVLEASSWLPLGLLGIYKASGDISPDTQRGRWHAGWLALSALTLGMSLLAGHPQTNLFLTYALIAYAVHRAARQRIAWKPTVLVVFAMLIIGYGLAAVQLIPGLEYMRLTTRTDMGFDARAGGFPFSDLLSIFVHGLTHWSPLYAGIPVLALAGIAAWRKQESACFWGITALISLGISFGGSTIMYHLAYLTAPGLALFRGQERIAYLIAYSLAIMAGLGAATLRNVPSTERRHSRVLSIAAILSWVLAIELFIARRIYVELDTLSRSVFFVGILVTLTWLVVGRLSTSAKSTWWQLALIGLIIFDLFSNTMNTNWEARPASDRTLYSELVPIALEDDTLYRVDGRLGLGGNFGTMVGLQDIWGVSPLRPKTTQAYGKLPQYRHHQLLAVKYVFTDWQQLEVPSIIRAEAEFQGFLALLHEITDPMPRAWMAYRTMIAPEDSQAWSWLADPSFDPRTTVILISEPELELPDNPPDDWSVEITAYEPEYIALDVDTPTDGILVLSEVDYPGWQATVDGVTVPIWHVDGGLRGLPLEAGQYHIELDYRPLSFTLGVGISIGALLVLLTLVVLQQVKQDAFYLS